MRTPSQVQTRLQVMWTRQWTQWVSGLGTWPLSLTLHPPSQEQAANAWDRFCHWRSSWETHANLVESKARRWSGLGTQNVPCQVLFPSAGHVADFLGERHARDWTLAVKRWRELTSLVPVTPELQKIIPWLTAASAQDLDRAVRVAQWLHENPQSGLYLRQIPVSGLDTKWVEHNRAAISCLLVALGGHHSPSRLESFAGLREDSPRCRFRVLDPHLRAQFGGLGDITAPIQEVARVSVSARVVLIVENLQTALACPDVPGAWVFFGSGFQATALADLPWLSCVPIVYWGDLDTAGFEILNALRGVFPHVLSFGMDEQTLLTHRQMWVVDPSPRRIDLGRLLPEEMSAYQALTNGKFGSQGIRLEQERLDWTASWHKLKHLLIGQNVQDQSTLNP